MTTDHMTGAELQTLREACHISRDELATLAGVQARTVKHWEGGRAGVPGDVVALVRKIDAQVSHAARQALAHMAGAVPDGAAVVFTRYRSADDLARYRPDMAGLPAGVQAAMVARVLAGCALGLGGTGVPGDASAPGAVVLRVVWFEPAAFEAWRAQHQQPNTEAARAMWAGSVALASQALPHRADQPPPGV